MEFNGFSSVRGGVRVSGKGSDEISRKIYEHMSVHHMCQAAVARAAGMSPKVFNDILKGRRTFKVEYLLPICNALGCTPNDILEG